MNLWDRLEGRVPVNRLARSVTKAALADDLPHTPEAKHVDPKDLRIIQLEQEVQYGYLVIEQLTDMCIDLCREIKRIAQGNGEKG
jgi:hypothetical protein